MYKAIIKGAVQNVGFRRVTKNAADREGLHGSVRNLSDGSVEIILDGPRSDLEQLIHGISQKLPPNCIESFAIEVCASPSLSPGFSILL